MHKRRTTQDNRHNYFNTIKVTIRAIQNPIVVTTAEEGELSGATSPGDVRRKCPDPD